MITIADNNIQFIIFIYFNWFKYNFS